MATSTAKKVTIALVYESIFGVCTESNSYIRYEFNKADSELNFSSMFGKTNFYWSEANKKKVASIVAKRLKK